MLFIYLKPTLAHAGGVGKTLWSWDVDSFYSTAGVVCRKLSIKYFFNIIFLYRHHCNCHRDDRHLPLGIKDEQKEGVQKRSMLYNIQRTYDPSNLNSLCKAK